MITYSRFVCRTAYCVHCMMRHLILRFLLLLTPRYITAAFIPTIFQPILILIFLREFLPTRMTLSVICAANLRPFYSIRCSVCLTARVPSHSTSFFVLPVTTIARSSTYPTRCTLFEVLTRNTLSSYMFYKFGTNTAPCETPNVISISSFCTIARVLCCMEL